jgi:glycosyltransferase involved in cell wall biosynthesis
VEAVKRILFVTPSYLPFVGGTTAFVAAMARRLAADGHAVTVLTTNARQAADFWQRPAHAPPPAKEILDGVTVERLALAYPFPAPYAFGLARRLGLWLTRTRVHGSALRPLLRRLAMHMPPIPDLETALERLAAGSNIIHVVESSWDGLFTAGVDTAQRHNIPCVATPLMHLGDAGIRAHYQMAHQVDAYLGATAVLALSQREAQTYIALGVMPERVHVIPMGVEGAVSAEQDGLRLAAFRGAQRIAGSIVAFLGANTYDKGAFTLALAAAQLVEAGVQVTAIFAGPQGDSLIAFLDNQEADIRTALLEHIRILGVVDENTKHALLAACDLLALPSQVDTFGIVLLEAWLHGKPVIGASAGGIPELVRHDENGLIVPFGDAATLAAAIRQLVADPNLAARLGAEGRRQVSNQYTWDRTYRILLDIYTKMGL